MKWLRAGVALLLAFAATGWSIALSGSVARADHTIEWIDCDTVPTPTPMPTPPPESGATPPPPEPPQNCTPEEDEVMTGTRVVAFEVRGGGFSSGVGEVVVSLAAETTGVADPGPLELSCPFTDDDPGADGCQYGERRGTGTYSFSWNAEALTPYNGSYELHVETSACNTPLCNESHPATRDRVKLKVDNPPDVLKAPRVLLATENTVTVEWDKAKELDVISYTLYRAYTENADTKPADKSFKAALTTTANAVRDEAGITPGAYWYKVRVTRRSVITPEQGISSPLSPRSGPGLVLGLQPTPPPPDAPPPPSAPRLRPHVASRPPPVPDAPFSVVLPYDVPEGESSGQATGPDVPEEGADPRGAVLPLAVGAFLVSASLALVRMPY